MNRSAGRALVVGSAACRAHVRNGLSRTPYEFAAADDPYTATIELCRRPLAYRVVILCLNSTYREELGLIGTIRRRLRHIDVYVAQTDGRAAALADAVRLGAAGLLADDGLHRISDDDVPEPRREPPPRPAARPIETPPAYSEDALSSGEAVLTADELRALLQEEPLAPPLTGQEG
jgi:hypothetical protein